VQEASKSSGEAPGRLVRALQREYVELGGVEDEEPVGHGDVEGHRHQASDLRL